MVYVLSHRIDPSAMKKVEIVDQPPINSSQQSNPRDSTFWQSAMQSSQPMDQPPINSSQQSNPRDSTLWQSIMQSSQPNTHIIDNTSSIRRSLKKEDNGNANPE